MLPFLKPKQVAGLIVEKRKPDGSASQEPEDNQDQALESAAADLIRAVHAKDEKAVAAAWRAGFEILESEPHDEAPHEEQEE